MPLDKCNYTFIALSTLIIYAFDKSFNPRIMQNILFSSPSSSNILMPLTNINHKVKKIEGEKSRKRRKKERKEEERERERESQYNAYSQGGVW